METIAAAIGLTLAFIGGSIILANAYLSQREKPKRKLKNEDFADPLDDPFPAEGSEYPIPPPKPEPEPTSIHELAKTALPIINRGKHNRSMALQNGWRIKPYNEHFCHIYDPYGNLVGSAFIDGIDEFFKNIAPDDAPLYVDGGNTMRSSNLD
jgi:hypothetical protein